MGSNRTAASRQGLSIFFVVWLSQVSVFIHWRQGAFGFLPVREPGEEGGTGGLNGIHDVIVALRWIQQNIHHYGGDPTRVSLFGESTGGSVVCFLAASPMAAGLFDSGVLASGPCSGLKELLPASVGRRYAKLFRQMLVLDVPNMTEADVDMDYMRSLPVEDVKNAWIHLQIHVDQRDKPVMFHDANLAFMDGLVLSQRPISYFAEGKANVKVVLMGSTSMDGTIFGEVGHIYPRWAAPGNTTWMLSGGKKVDDVDPQVPWFRVPKASEYEEQVLRFSNYTFHTFPCAHPSHPDSPWDTQRYIHRIHTASLAH
jgi:carboxylesterase type B